MVINFHFNRKVHYFEKQTFFLYILEEASIPECQLTDWSPWSSCSVSCGYGIKTRRRAYLMPDKAFRHHCDYRTFDMASCHLESCSSAMAHVDSKQQTDSMYIFNLFYHLVN